MPKGYWIVRVDVSDQEQYKSYVAANAAPLKQFGARFLVRGGAFENPEGSSRVRGGTFEKPEGSARQRNVVIEFPSYQAAIDCWHSPGYQEALKLRTSVSTADVVIIGGHEGPQP